MGFARICRCNPWGGAGYDPAPAVIPENASAVTPWRYGRWKCEAVD
jgi:putative component of membrane protein insertase Oxa1/YidC/SpoIIIJ protein YidD